MKKLIRLFIALFGVFLISCDNDNVTPGKEVEIYLLKSFETAEQSDIIKDSGIQLEEEPLLTYSDLLSYNLMDHSFELSDRGKTAILGNDYSSFRKTFAVVVDDEIIYTGYFWSASSSSICQWVISDLLTVEMQGKMKLQLGYPGFIDGAQIPDRRNDKRILEAFKKDGKLDYN